MSSENFTILIPDYSIEKVNNGKGTGIILKITFFTFINIGFYFQRFHEPDL